LEILNMSFLVCCGYILFYHLWGVCAFLYLGWRQSICFFYFLQIYSIKFTSRLFLFC
jgi:hypothetical protein